MKKYYLLFILLPFMCFSCGDDEDKSNDLTGSTWEYSVDEKYDNGNYLKGHELLIFSQTSVQYTYSIETFISGNLKTDKSTETCQYIYNHPDLTVYSKSGVMILKVNGNLKSMALDDGDGNTSIFIRR